MFDRFQIAGLHLDGSDPMLLGLILTIEAIQGGSLIGYCLDMTARESDIMNSHLTVHLGKLFTSSQEI